MRYLIGPLVQVEGVTKCVINQHLNNSDHLFGYLNTRIRFRITKMRERPVELEMDCYDTEGNLGFRSVVGGSMEIIINVINNFNSIPFIAYYVRNRGGAQLFGN